MVLVMTTVSQVPDRCAIGLRLLCQLDPVRKLTPDVRTYGAYRHIRRQPLCLTSDVPRAGALRGVVVTLG